MSLGDAPYPPDPDPLYDFCGFDRNGSSFRTKYFFNEHTFTLTPCGEMFMVLLQTVPLLFYSVAEQFLVHSLFPRVPAASPMRHVLSFRLLLSSLSALLLLLSVVGALASPSSLSLQRGLLIEYGVCAVCWTAYAVLWLRSRVQMSWTHSRGLSVSYFFASKTFVLMTVDRWFMYGIRDARTIVPLVLFTLHMVNTILNCVERGMRKDANRPRRLSSDGDHPSDYVYLDEDADEGAGWVSRLFFCWTHPLIEKGWRGQLNELDDVFGLPPSLQVSAVERELVQHSPTFYSDGQHYSIARSLLSTFGAAFFSLALLRLASDAFTFAGPVLLHLLVEALELPEAAREAVIVAGLMSLTSFLAAMFSSHFSYNVQKISIRVRSATVTAIYDKLLRVPLSEMSSFSTGQILNFISTDVDRIVNFCNSFHAFWSLPVQLAIALYLLYREIGMAYISGLAAAIVLIPINKVITNSIGRMSEKMMKAKDNRVKMTTETMEGIRAVKMSGWEGFFERKINDLRERELKYLKARKYLDAVCVYLWASAPLLITIAILATHTLVLHETLTAAKVFTSLALVNILIMPLNAFPWVLNGLVEALVSLKRLEWFFALKNMEMGDIYQLSSDQSTLLEVRSGSFFWKGSHSAVTGVNIEGKKGSIVGVTGPVGCGKSTLLLGMLGETKMIIERLGVQQPTINEGVAYVAQGAWLSRGTVRENIVAGKPFDAVQYDRAIRTTCLQRDINLMPGGDGYVISEGGVTLSGGQRARLALARAIYQDNSVYLLDDPFASLDRAVADTIWREVVQGLKQRGKLVVVATHDVRLLQHADEVVLLSCGGQVDKIGAPSEVLSEEALSQAGAHTSDETAEEETVHMEHVKQQEEEKQVGAVRASVYGAYARATGICLAAAIIVSLCAMQASKNTADWWLSQWTASNVSLDHAPSSPAHEGVMRSVQRVLWGERQSNVLSWDDLDRSIRFLIIYACLAGANTLFTLIRAFLFAYGGVVAARRLHSTLLRSLLSAAVSWWDRTPSGRVINRLCSDVYTCDDNLPFQLNILLASLFNLAGALVISIIGLPLLAPVVTVLFIIYYFVQRYYRKTTVELKRLTSLSLSPFYSHLSDTVNGLATIRAARWVERATVQLRHRLASHLRAQFSSLAAAQWLSMRLSLLAVAVVTAVAGAAIAHHLWKGVDSGLVGLAITYALSMTGLLNGLLGSFIETEKEMVSVERIDEYVHDVKAEEDEGTGELPRSLTGSVDFACVSLRYERGLPLALENVSLQIEGGKRAAIVGRTGSGKTSIMQALLRATPIESGRILIDGIDIHSVPLHHLRKMFGVVPQQPLLFSGTLFENVAVDCEGAEEADVARLLRQANMDGVLARLGGLGGEVEEGGKNLSHGERQVIAICRVLLAKPAIVLVDEATAHMDAASHRRMWQLLTSGLPKATMLCIVHNLEGLSEYDVVIRMEAGRIRSVGPPE